MVAALSRMQPMMSVPKCLWCTASHTRCRQARMSSYCTGTRYTFLRHTREGSACGKAWRIPGSACSKACGSQDLHAAGPCGSKDMHAAGPCGSQDLHAAGPCGSQDLHAAG